MKSAIKIIHFLCRKGIFSISVLLLSFYYHSIAYFYIIIFVLLRLNRIKSRIYKKIYRKLSSHLNSYKKKQMSKKLNSSILMESNSIKSIQPKKQRTSINLLKNYLMRKTQNMYKLHLSDQQAFKWKFNREKNNRQLSCFKLLKKQPTEQQEQFAQLQQLKQYSFPVLAHKTKDLAQYAILILKDNQYFRSELKDDEDFLRKLVTQISLNYNIVSYHNFSHAFSLSLMLYQVFHYHLDLNNIFSTEEKFYAILAGLAHDMSHPGTNNAFQIKTKSKEAIQFNNESVLQNFHLKQFWRLLDKIPEIDFLAKVSNPQQVKKRITYLILSTDVAQHFKNLQKFKALLIQIETNNQDFMANQERRQFFLGQLFHGCDIGNPCIDFQNYITWAALLSHQFNQQTILEKQNQVEVTEMLKYKDLTTFYKGQLGFINFLVMPLWKQITKVCTKLIVFKNNIDKNIQLLNQHIVNAKEEDQNILQTKFI